MPFRSVDVLNALHNLGNCKVQDIKDYMNSDDPRERIKRTLWLLKKANRITGNKKGIYKLTQKGREYLISNNHLINSLEQVKANLDDSTLPKQTTESTQAPSKKTSNFPLSSAPPTPSTNKAQPLTPSQESSLQSLTLVFGEHRDMLATLENIHEQTGKMIAAIKKNQGITYEQK